MQCAHYISGLILDDHQQKFFHLDKAGRQRQFKLHHSFMQTHTLALCHSKSLALKTERLINQYHSLRIFRKLPWYPLNRRHIKFVYLFGYLRNWPSQQEFCHYFTIYFMSNKGCTLLSISWNISEMTYIFLHQSFSRTIHHFHMTCWPIKPVVSILRIIKIG